MSIMIGLAIYFVLLAVTVPLLLLFLSCGRNEQEEEYCFYEYLHDVQSSSKRVTSSEPVFSLAALAEEIKIEYFLPRT